jgi:hypothetical protein
MRYFILAMALLAQQYPRPSTSNPFGGKKIRRHHHVAKESAGL